MTIKQVYELTLKMGVESDPRGKVGVEKYLRKINKEYGALPAKRREYFDKDRLINPYSDTKIHFGDPSSIVDKILVGIDIEVGEVVLADRLNQRGEGIDLLISHHPEGVSLAGIHEVMDLQIEHFAKVGVPIHIAEALTGQRVSEVKRKFSPINHFRSVDAARLLNFPFMSVHTPADNLVYKYLLDRIKESDFDTVADVLEMLMGIDEYKEATKGKAGPCLFVGKEGNRAGRVVPMEITGGTEGAKELYERVSKAGVSTIIAVHASENHTKEAEKYHINLIVAGHIASDSIGMNLFLDELEKQGVGILPCSGLIRVRRT